MKKQKSYLKRDKRKGGAIVKRVKMKIREQWVNNLISLDHYFKQVKDL